MSTAFDAKRFGIPVEWLEWLPVFAGLLVLYVPVFYEFATTLWQEDEHAHGPIILMVIIGLLWEKRTVLLTAATGELPALGIAVLTFGLLFYVVGRSQDITIFQIGALAPVLAGAVLAMRGRRALRVLWFPIFFVVFMVPLPGFFVDAVTGPLKQNISEIVEYVLYAAGYPIARNGVMLTIGQYQLLVADACSGLHSMYSLSALGLLFMHLTARAKLMHNAVMLASILPIAFAANIVRVLVLMLITYHFGDAAGQGFLHGAAGIVLLIAALSALILLDYLLAKVFTVRKPA
jgi:exosortase B